MFWLISLYAVNIFFADQWAFNDATLFQKHSLWQMFAWQHGPHRQGVGALFEKMVDPIFGWNSRTESFVVGGVIVIAAATALYLKYRLYGKLSVFDVVIPAIIFTPAQWQSLFETANFAHGPFPLLLLLLYCLAWTCPKRVVRYGLVLLINFVLIYTGFGVFLGILTPILLAVDYWSSNPQDRLPGVGLALTLLAALGSLGFFFHGYKFNAAIDCFSFQPRRPKEYAAFVDLMFANFFTVKGTHGFVLVLGGALLLSVLIAMAAATSPLLSRRDHKGRELERSRHLIVLALTAYTLLFCVNTAYGRLCGGLPMALAPRYVIYIEPALLGVYFHLHGIGHRSWRKWLLRAFLLAVVAASFRTDRKEMGHISDVKQRWKACYLRVEDIKRCDQAAGFPIHPPHIEQTYLEQKLQFLKQRRLNLYQDSR
jgi:hypothetical protein